MADAYEIPTLNIKVKGKPRKETETEWPKGRSCMERYNSQGKENIARDGHVEVGEGLKLVQRGSKIGRASLILAQLTSVQC